MATKYAGKQVGKSPSWEDGQETMKLKGLTPIPLREKKPSGFINRRQDETEDIMANANGLTRLISLDCQQVTHSSWSDNSNIKVEQTAEKVPVKKAGHKRLNQAQRKKLAAQLTIQIDPQSYSAPSRSQTEAQRTRATHASKGSQLSHRHRGSLATTSQKTENIPLVATTSLIPTSKHAIQEHHTLGDSHRTAPHLNILAGSTALTEPLSDFTLFPELAAELRLRIWHHTFCHERIIELEWHRDDGENSDDPGFWMHQRVDVTQACSKPPAVLHVCHEAREEGLKYYELRDFESHTSGTPQKIYFNPAVDIIYFGSRACNSTIIQFCRQRQEVRRVACDVTGRMTKCCDWDEDGSPYSDNFGGSIPGNCSPIHALHGVDPEIAINRGFPGCKGLKDLFWIIPTNYTFGGDEVNSDTTLRRAITNGLTNGQIRAKERLVGDLKELNSGGMKNIGKNNWEGKHKPMIHFSSLVQRGDGHRHHKIVAMECWPIKKLQRIEGFFESLQTRSHCVITICPMAMPTQKEFEVGFYGTDSEIKTAQDGIQQKLTLFDNQGRESQQGTYRARAGRRSGRF